MRRIIVIWIICSSPIIIQAQQINPDAEQQLENKTASDDNITEDDSWLQELEQFRHHPLNLNTAGKDELMQLRIFTDLQMANLLAYREIYGHFISIYELQAVPAWNIQVIKKILPFITIAEARDLPATLRNRFHNGEHSVLLRMGYSPGTSSLYNDSLAGHYLGNPLRLVLRYRYSYKNLLQYGITGDKDAGEPFFRGKQKTGFDFYSFHFFSRHTGLVKSVALGDFTINMGQGLIQWQSLAFKKSADVLAIKRQSALLRPYSSTGESNFYRGAGLTMQKGRISSAVFFSFRKISGNIIHDSLSGETYVSSFLTTGYHRTVSENEDRDNISQVVYGGTLAFQGHTWHLGMNGVAFGFSEPVKKKEEPYNLFAFSGAKGYNLSTDYSYTKKNIHFFGELAADKNFRLASINGLLISADPKVDISFLYRHISKGFQAPAGNAFTESTLPVNENGFYAGISIRPLYGWKLEAYADIYEFPWLRYLSDAPARGTSYLVQLSYTPSKQVEIYSRFMVEDKQANQPGFSGVTDFLIYNTRKNWRSQVSFKLNPAFLIRTRAEIVRLGKRNQPGEKGFLGYTDLVYKPMMTPYSGCLRFQYFETDGYESRVYAFENDVLYSFSIPAFFHKGMRYYLIINYDLSKKCSVWVRWAQTSYPGKPGVLGGQNPVGKVVQSDLKAQVIWHF